MSFRNLVMFTFCVMLLSSLFLSGMEKKVPEKTSYEDLKKKVAELEVKLQEMYQKKEMKRLEKDKKDFDDELDELQSDYMFTTQVIDENNSITWANEFCKWQGED